ncbi:MAG TPA: SDR family oxidoreductase [Solimonas sp.]
MTHQTHTNPSNIAGKVVVITGASSGLGEATARHLAGLGARVVLGARRAGHLERLVAEIRAAGGEAIATTTDVTDRDQVETLVARAVDQYGRIDVMVNNAGYMALAPMARLKVEEWDRMIDINIKGVLNGVAAALPRMQAQGSGHIINVASVAGTKVFSPIGAVYSATKFAVRALSEGLRAEVGSRIRTTVISPGAVASELKHGSSDAESSKAVGEWYSANEIPAESVARAMAFAISQPPEVDINEILLRPTAQEF